MRIITGKYKGRHFDIPRSFKARPTTDFAKENIFNVLTGYIDFEGATALDLFSGTGSITLELLSRGCAGVVSVELDRDHHRFIRQCVESLSPSQPPLPQRQQQASSPLAPWKGIRGDAFRFIKSCKQQFDFIFADPPYALKELPTIPSLILGTAVANSGVPTVTSDLKLNTVASDLSPSASFATRHPSLLKPGGIFVLEHGKDYDFSQHPHFLEHRSYGSVNFSLFK